MGRKGGHVFTTGGGEDHVGREYDAIRPDSRSSLAVCHFPVRPEVTHWIGQIFPHGARRVKAGDARLRPFVMRGEIGGAKNLVPERQDRAEVPVKVSFLHRVMDTVIAIVAEHAAQQAEMGLDRSVIEHGMERPIDRDAERYFEGAETQEKERHGNNRSFPDRLDGMSEIAGGVNIA